METKHTKPMKWSVDVWMFLAMFAGAAFVFHDEPAIMALFFFVFILYLTADNLVPYPFSQRIRLFVVVLSISLFVFGFSLMYILLRHSTAPYLFVHDGLIQVEEAIKFLLAGKNPYVENYTNTSLSNWNFVIGTMTENPALFHNAYLPFTFLFLLPFYIVSTWILGWFDGRMVFLPQFFAILVILARWVKDDKRRIALILFVAFNPFFFPYLIQGRNDVLVLFWLIASVAFLRNRHESWAMVMLGLACASKWTAWFIIPFFALYLYQPPIVGLGTWFRSAFVSSPRWWVLWVLTVGLIVLPFFLWQPNAFVDDVWNYPNGTSAISPYPVSGYGFNVLMQTVGLLPHDAVRSSFEILQWIFGVPLLIILLWRQLDNNTMSQMWFGYALLLAVMGFFSHVLNDNHIGFILTLFATAAFIDEPSPVSAPGVQ